MLFSGLSEKIIDILKKEGSKYWQILFTNFENKNPK